MKKMKIDSFQIEQEITIEASRETVYKALTAEIDKWWTFRLGENESKLSIDPKINGLFFEDWGNGEGAVWGTITYLKENEEIRLNGILGMKGAVNSYYSYRLETVGNATVLKLSHEAIGFLEPHWEEAHKHGWNELLQQNLKTYIEKSEGL
ncbi:MULTISPECIES: SRPBCC domain-containing protein [unclassified Bacillus (in: firmicutes)]|uniref:SRPBCC family protein n=1 Tax=unclassified Bacillus (in: firmicutes) TaxID=185979 RepID=UPI0008EE5994|nr:MULTISPECIES: SRPBCC domain-containing protein [unclassified Bacillus (in: firmicutes)]SFA87058.1 Activator of Hsp90 ATPase homolog 1-like protein [Bacillus sp. UNCCL13]SFQ84045.1 Activator of Hsp90 ATPase homolog 1-like protein [Bacillus sp. cl95]